MAAALCGSERVLQRRALRCEQFRAVLGSVHIVFEAYAELAANVDPGFIAESHVGRKRGGVASNTRVRPFPCHGRGGA